MGNEDFELKNICKIILNKMDNSQTISAIRRGLIMILSVLMLGSFALILKSMPIAIYQNFISSVFSGAFLQMLNFIYDATFGLLSVYISFSIAIYYIRSMGAKSIYAVVGGLTSVVSFFILSGVDIEEFVPEPLGARGMFTAIFNYLICNVFGVNSFHDFYVYIIGLIFSGKDASFSNGFMFVVTSSVLWFFGIHGSDVLEGVSEKIFSTEIEKNIRLVEIGKAPTHILTRQFFDQFVLLGGCGAAICLLIAIMFFSKRKINRNLSKIAGLPMIFNV